jgi:hypothetical protein
MKSDTSRSAQVDDYTCILQQPCSLSLIIRAVQVGRLFFRYLRAISMEDLNWLYGSGTLTESHPALSPGQRKRKRLPSLTLDCDVARPRPPPQPMYQTSLQHSQVQHRLCYPQLYPQHDQYRPRQPKRQFQQPGRQQQQCEIQRQRYDMQQEHYDIPQYQPNRFTQGQNYPLQYLSQQQLATYPSPSPFKLSDSPFITQQPPTPSAQFHITHKREAESVVLSPADAIDPDLLDPEAIRLSCSSSQFSMRSSVLRSAQAFLQDSPYPSPESVCVPFRKALDRFREKVEDLCHLVREPTSERSTSLLESIEAEKEVIDREYIALKRRWIVAQQTWLKSGRNIRIDGMIEPASSNHKVTISSSSLSLASSTLQDVQEAFANTQEHLSSTQNPFLTPQNPFSGTMDHLWGIPVSSGIGTSFSDASILSSLGPQQPPSV